MGNLAYSGDNRRMAQLENFRLKVFRTVAKHLSSRKAAEHLFVTQPAVTFQESLTLDGGLTAQRPLIQHAASKRVSDQEKSS